MKQIAACLLVAIGIGGAGYIANKTLVPFATSCFELDYDMSDLAADLLSDWHLKSPSFHTPCFGLCPEMESWSW